jgi:hypothetical protein
MPANFSLGCVVDTSRMFHAAVAASNFPARRPTRGSGVGSPADMFALLPAVVETAELHAAAEKRPSASANENNGATDDRTAVRRRYTDAIVDTSNVADWELGILVNGLITDWNAELDLG